MQNCHTKDDVVLISIRVLIHMFMFLLQTLSPFIPSDVVNHSLMGDPKQFYLVYLLNDLFIFTYKCKIEGTGGFYRQMATRIHTLTE